MWYHFTRLTKTCMLLSYYDYNMTHMQPPLYCYYHPWPV